VPFYPLVPRLFTAASAGVLVSSVLYVGWVGCAISFGMLALGLVVRAGLLRSAA
jgi:hypothetical protein